jgi:hypothetical protein
MAIGLDELEQKVKALSLSATDFLIFGSAPLLIHGLVSTINDIDLVARGSAWEKAKTYGEVLQGKNGDRLIQLGSIDIYDGWMSEKIAGLMERARFVRGLPYASLEDVLRYKLKLNRPKDAKHITLIQVYLEKTV